MLKEKKEEKRFDFQKEKERFKGVCIGVLPAIAEIERVLKANEVSGKASLRISEDSFVSFDIYDSNWRMVRYQADAPAKIIYEYSEEMNAPDKERETFGHITENIMEITLVYAEMLRSNKKLNEIDSIEWKQQFVEWANEFEENWSEDTLADYPEEIGKFARKKIAAYAGLEVS